jgi:hypothetical protein
VRAAAGKANSRSLVAALLGMTGGGRVREGDDDGQRKMEASRHGRDRFRPPLHKAKARSELGNAEEGDYAEDFFGWYVVEIAFVFLLETLA